MTEIYLSDIAMRIAIEMEAQAALRTSTAEKAEAICDILSGHVAPELSPSRLSANDEGVTDEQVEIALSVFMNGDHDKAGDDIKTHWRNSMRDALTAALSTKPEAVEQNATNDQIASVMLQHGTDEQKREALAYAGIPTPASGEQMEVIANMWEDDDARGLMWGDTLPAFHQWATLTPLVTLDAANKALGDVRAERDRYKVNYELCLEAVNAEMVAHGDTGLDLRAAAERIERLEKALRIAREELISMFVNERVQNPEQTDEIVAIDAALHPEGAQS